MLDMPDEGTELGQPVRMLDDGFCHARSAAAHIDATPAANGSQALIPIAVNDRHAFTPVMIRTGVSPGRARPCALRDNGNGLDPSFPVCHVWAVSLSLNCAFLWATIVGTRFAGNESRIDG